MKRTLNSAVQMTAVPCGINLFRLGTVGGAINAAYRRSVKPIIELNNCSVQFEASVAKVVLGDVATFMALF